MDQGFCVFEMLFDEARQPVDYRFLEVNPMFEKQTGLKNAVGKTARELVPGLERHWFDLYGNVALTGESTRFVQGSEAMGRWFEVYAYRTGELGTHQVALLFTDITQRKQVEQALLEKDKAIHRIFQKAPVAIAIFRGPEFIIELANEANLAIWGRTADQVIDKPLFEVFPEATGQGFKELLTNVFRTGEPFYAKELPADIERDGKLVTIYSNFVYEALREADDSISGVIMVATEITNQVTALRKAEESEQETKALLESAPFAISVNVGEDMRIQQANQAMLEAWGKGSEVIGKSLREVVPELGYNDVFENYSKVLQTGEPFYRRNERFDLQKDGVIQSFYFNYNFTPLFDQQGKVYGVVNAAADVTDLNLAKKKVEQSEANLRNIILQAPVAMCLFKGPKYVLEIANERMCEIWGTVGLDILDKPIFEAIPEARNQGFEGLLSKVMHQGETVKVYGMPVTLTRNGEREIFYVDVVYEPYREADGTILGIMAVATDVTEQVIAHKQIEAAQASLRNAIDIAELGTWRYETATQLMTYSPRMMEWYGFDNEKIQYQTVLESFEEKARPRHQRYLNNDFDWQDDGTLADVHTIVNQKTGQTHIIQSIGKPIRDEKGTLVYIEGMSRDVTKEYNNRQALETEVKQRTEQLAAAIEDLQLVNTELQRSNANLEEFAYAASHDLKEPVRKINIFMGRLKLQLADKLGPDDAYIFSRVEDASQRMNALIDDLLLYSHVNYRLDETERVDLNEKVKRVMEDLELDIESKKAQIYIEELPVVNGYGRQLQQLFQNLLSNALKYNRLGVSPVVSITTQVVQGGDIGLLATKEYHLITVRDNGIGFDQTYSDKIFQMFKRLHNTNEYQGTGVGLSIARKVVENHFGRITAEGKPGEGATFKIYLPV